MNRRPRVAFVNCGFLGHRAMADAMRDIAGRLPIDAVHLNLSDELSLSDRLVRRAFSVQLAPADGALANLDFRRWRQEMHVGVLAARRLAAAERLGAFDLVHFHTQNAAYASLARMARTPTIVSIDATSQLASAEAASGLARWTYRPNIGHDGLVFRAARAIVTTSSWAARDLARQCPECAGRTHVLPYPVRDVFGADWARERAGRAASSAPVRVLFVGGDFPRKGGPALLEAWRAAQFGSTATLTLVTDWPLPADLPPGVTQVRRLAAYSPEWVDLWRSADAFVMPTEREAFGIVYEEAAAAGLPAIGTAINAIPEIIADGETGLLVPAGDRAALVRAMRALVESPELRRRLGVAARDRVARAAFPAAYAEKFGAVIAPLLACHATQPS